jgi:hypothetical protein
MNNEQLQQQLTEILSTKNFFDMLEKAVEFEKEYKQSGFYKKTKMPLIEVLKYNKVWSLMNLDGLMKNIQERINSLDLSNLTNIIGQAGELFAMENEEIQEMIKEVKNITL